MDQWVLYKERKKLGLTDPVEKDNLCREITDTISTRDKEDISSSNETESLGIEEKEDSSLSVSPNLKETPEDNEIDRHACLADSGANEDEIHSRVIKSKVPEANLVDSSCIQANSTETEQNNYSEHIKTVGSISINSTEDSLIEDKADISTTENEKPCVEEREDLSKADIAESKEDFISKGGIGVEYFCADSLGSEAEEDNTCIVNTQSYLVSSVTEDKQNNCFSDSNISKDTIDNSDDIAVKQSRYLDSFSETDVFEDGTVNITDDEESIETLVIHVADSLKTFTEPNKTENNSFSESEEQIVFRSCPAPHLHEVISKSSFSESIDLQDDVETCQSEAQTWIDDNSSTITEFNTTEIKIIPESIDTCVVDSGITESVITDIEDITDKSDAGQRADHISSQEKVAFLEFKEKGEEDKSILDSGQRKSEVDDTILIEESNKTKSSSVLESEDTCGVDICITESVITDTQVDENLIGISNTELQKGSIITKPVITETEVYKDFSEIKERESRGENIKIQDSFLEKEIAEDESLTESGERKGRLDHTLTIEELDSSISSLPLLYDRQNSSVSVSLIGESLHIQDLEDNISEIDDKVCIVWVISK